MVVCAVSLRSIRLRDAWDRPWPLRPDFFAELEGRLPGWPLLVLDAERRLVFAADYLTLLRGRGALQARALETETRGGESLLLGLQLRRVFCGLNPWEELEGARRLLPLMDAAGIQRRLRPAFALDGGLQAQLPVLTGKELRPALASGAVGLRAARRLLSFSAANRRAMLALFRAVHCSESHQHVLLDLVEEIAFATRRTVAGLLRRAGVPALLAARAPARALVEALQARRFPRTAALEREWREKLRSLRLPPGARVDHAPFFEKPGLELGLHLGGWEELERLLAALGERPIPGRKDPGKGVPG